MPCASCFGVHRQIPKANWSYSDSTGVNSDVKPPYTKRILAHPAV